MAAIGKDLKLGLEHLTRELGLQILPDGGHVSRSPEALLDAFRWLSVVQRGRDSAGHESHAPLRGALDRMGLMLRFLRMGDGALPVFNGGNEGEAQVLVALGADNEHEARPLAHAPDSGYQRLASGQTLILLDAGCAPA